MVFGEGSWTSHFPENVMFKAQILSTEQDVTMQDKCNSISTEMENIYRRYIFFYICISYIYLEEFLQSCVRGYCIN